MTKKASRRKKSGRTKPVLLGGIIGGLSAYAGMRFGVDQGYMVPILAAIAGALLAARFVSYSRESANPEQGEIAKNDGVADLSPSGSRVGASVPAPDPAVESEPESVRRVSLFVEPAPGEPDWPIETHEVQLKLDLAREYLDADETDLAANLLEEVIEIEVFTARKLAAEILRESDDSQSGPLNA